MAFPQAGTQFITGTCAADSDCASGCCGFNSGKCAGPVVAQQRDGGCGFGNAAPNADAAKALGSGIAAPGVQGAGADAAGANTQAAATQNTGANGVASAAGTQFITGTCTADSDCASGCCGFNSGKCAGAVVAQERDGGCGFGDQTPNDNAVKALNSTVATPGAQGAKARRNFMA